MASEDSARRRGRKPAQGEPVVDRALGILDAFDEQGGSLTLAQIVSRTNLPKATALRLINRLVKWGALERTTEGAYVIGLRLLEVATLAPRGHGLRSTAVPFLQDLHRATRQHVLLAVLDGQQAVLIERFSAHQIPPSRYRIGGRLPIDRTTVGLALLAFTPFEARTALLETIASDPERTRTEEELRQEIARIRSSGFAMLTGIDNAGAMVSVAAPIFGPRRELQAAISVLASEQSGSVNTYIPAVVTIARSISRALGADQSY